MKTHLFFSVIIFLSLPFISNAQEAETLFNGNVSHGGFGSIMVGVTSINGEAAYMRGTRGAWMLKFNEGHALNIGLGGYHTQSGFDAVNWNQADTERPELNAQYGGFELEYLNRSYKLIHYGAHLLIGGGTVKYRSDEVNLDKTSDTFFALQPGVNAHVNLASWFRVSGGLYYRLADGVNLAGTSNSDLSGVSAIFSFRFGKF